MGCLGFTFLPETDMTVVLLDKTYDGESVVDHTRDVSEAFDKAFTPDVANIPVDEYGFWQGSFKVVITWTPDTK